MSKEKHFVDTSVLRPLISASSKVKDYYKNEFQGNIYYCNYVKMEFIRGFIIPCIEFYYTIKMPNVTSLSDALNIWSNRFKGREVKSILILFSELIRVHDFDLNEIDHKDKAAIRIADYIRRLISSLSYKFKDVGIETQMCEKGKYVFQFDPNQIDTSFKALLERYHANRSNTCTLNKFMLKHQKSITKIIENQDIRIKNSNHFGFHSICSELSKNTEYTCAKCAKIGDFIISAISPNEMRLEHTDYSFDYIMEILNKKHYRHLAEVNIIK